MIDRYNYFYFIQFIVISLLVLLLIHSSLWISVFPSSDFPIMLLTISGSFWFHQMKSWRISVHFPWVIWIMDSTHWSWFTWLLRSPGRIYYAVRMKYLFSLQYHWWTSGRLEMLEQYLGLNIVEKDNCSIFLFRVFSVFK